MYRSLGYKAYAIDFDVHGNTHCMTAVYIGDGWVLEDATFNYVFANFDGSPVFIDHLLMDNDVDLFNKVTTLEGKSTESLALSTRGPENWSSYPIVQTLNQKGERHMYYVELGDEHYSAFNDMRDSFLSDGYGDSRINILHYICNVYKYYNISDLVLYKKTLKGQSEFIECLGLDGDY